MNYTNNYLYQSTSQSIRCLSVSYNKNPKIGHLMQNHGRIIIGLLSSITHEDMREHIT